MVVFFKRKRNENFTDTRVKKFGKVKMKRFPSTTQTVKPLKLKDDMKKDLSIVLRIVS